MQLLHKLSLLNIHKNSCHHIQNAMLRFEKPKTTNGMTLALAAFRMQQNQLRIVFLVSKELLPGLRQLRHS